MIKKLHEEWERLSQEASQLQARQVAEQDPKRHQDLLDRMNAVGGALRKLSQGSVTRTTLSQAVRDALADILKSDRELLFPEVAGLKAELAEVRGALERDLSELRRRSESAEGRGALEQNVAGEITRLDGRLKGLEGSLGERLARLEGRLAQELGPSGARNGGGLWDVTRRIDQDVSVLKTHIQTQIEKASADSAARLDSRIAEVERRIDGAGGPLAEQNARLERLASELSRGGAELARKVEEQSARLAALAHDLGSADDNLAEGLKDLEGRLGRRLLDLEAASQKRSEALEAALRQSLAAAETRLTESQGRLEVQLQGRVEAVAGRMGRDLQERIAKVEAALPELRAMGERLQNQMRSAMAELEEKVNVVVDMLGQIQAGLPARQLFEGLDERLVRMETRLRTVSDQLDGLLETSPLVRSLGEQLAGIHGELTGLVGEVSGSEKELRDVRDHFARRIQDLQDLLRASTERWEAGRENVRQRLVDLRDTLRDQLQSAGEYADSGLVSFWGKLRGKAEGGLRFEAADWERFRARLETIAQGLEGLLTEGK